MREFADARVKYMRLATFFGGLIRDSLVDSGLFALYSVSDYGHFFDDSQGFSYVFKSNELV
jgi:hypothetical protein